MKKLTLVIEEDIFQNCSYQVFFNNKIITGNFRDNKKEYTQFVDEQVVSIKIVSEDEWNPKEKLNLIYSWLISLDFQFGSVYERLPIYAYYLISVNLALYRDDCLINIKNSDFLKSETKSIESWEKALALQNSIFIGGLFLIQVLIILILELWSTSSFLIVTIFIYVVKRKLLKRGKQLSALLYEFAMKKE